jgi:hypothetical protein
LLFVASPNKDLLEDTIILAGINEIYTQQIRRSQQTRLRFDRKRNLKMARGAHAYVEVTPRDATTGSFLTPASPFRRGPPFGFVEIVMRDNTTGNTIVEIYDLP